MTGEHQVQSLKRVLKMLDLLLSYNGSGLRKLNQRIQQSKNAKSVLDALEELDMIGPFFAWQIFSDLVAVQILKLIPKDLILPPVVVEHSRFNYALFGPGARKGAYIIDGGAVEVLEFDRDTNQEKALNRGKRILNEFPLALKRMGLNEEWTIYSQGREFDLETCEHMLCEFYGSLKGTIAKTLLSDKLACELMKGVAKKAGCVWPPERKGAPGGSQSARKSAWMSAWRPNPCTTLEREDLLRMIDSTAPKFKNEG